MGAKRGRSCDVVELELDKGIVAVVQTRRIRGSTRQGKGREMIERDDWTIVEANTGRKNG